MTSEQRDKGKKSDLYRDLEASMAGIELVVSTLIGTGLGYLADRHFYTFPYLMVIGFILGTVTGFRNAFRLIRNSEKCSEEKGPKKGEDS